MLAPQDFHIEIGHDDKGIFVKVLHLPTEQQRFARPNHGQKVSRVQEKLHAELVRTFLNMNDFRVQMGRCDIDGKIGDFYRVEHLPSNRTKSLDTITSPHVKSPQQVLELLLEDL